MMKLGPEMSRTWTLVKGVAALVVLAALVVGLPAALLAVASSPIPTSLPDLSQVWDAATSQDDGTLLLGLLKYAAWFGWLLFTVSVLADLAARARRMPAPHLGPQQALASRLVAAVAALAVLAPTTATAAVVTPPAPPAAALADHSISAPAAPAGSSAWAGASARLVAADTAATAAAESGTPAVEPRAQKVWQDYTVDRGDTLWDIAERELGDPYRWTELYGATLTVKQPDGQWLTDPNLILVGWTVRVPRMVEVPVTPSPAQGPVDEQPATPFSAGNHRTASHHDSSTPAPVTPLRTAPSAAPSWRAEVLAALGQSE